MLKFDSMYACAHDTRVYFHLGRTYAHQKVGQVLDAKE